MSAAVSSTAASSGINGAAAATAAASPSSAAAAAPSRQSPSKASALLTGGPPRPIALRKTSRSVSIITPTSTTLLNASVVQKDEETGEESHLRPLSDADVLCGRGGLVNGFIGNITFRKLVAERRDEYRDAKKKAKALIAQGIVDEIKSRGGLFLHRVDIDNDGGKGTGTHKNGGKPSSTGSGGDGSPSKSKGGTGIDAQGSKWADISEGKAREKTSQALREGAEVRKSSIGSRSVTTGSENGSVSLASATKAMTSFADPPSLEASASKASTVSQKTRKKRKSENSTSTNSSLTAFLPPTLAAFVEDQSSSSSSADQHETIKSPDDFERIVSKPRDGKQRLAQRLFDWNATRSESDQSNEWMAALGTVDLWRRQVDVWADALSHLKSAENQQKQQEGNGPGEEDDGDGGTSKKAKTASQESSKV